MRRDDTEFLLQDVGDASLLVPLNTKLIDLNGIVSLNAAGRYLWEQLAEERSLDELASALAERFGLTLSDARRDAQSFVEQVAPLGLLK
jgi:hypothetical protein